MPTWDQNRIGRYEILTELGRGAMGTVYKARDPMIDRLVAIKTISIHGCTPEDARDYRDRFFREARAAGRLSHPGIVTIYDVDEDPERGPYIVMEYVPGQTLDRLLSGGAEEWSCARALDLADQLAQALHIAHSQRIVHRDIKPANIIVGDDGRAKITDFGVAKLDLTQFTAQGVVFGTPQYMAPEQLEGGAVDARSDLFSLGVVLYSMLTGYRPFQGNSAATISFKVMHKEPVPVSALNASLPLGIDYVTSRALAKTPDQRYQSAQEFSLDLQDIQSGSLPRSQGGGAGAGSGARRVFQVPGATNRSNAARGQGRLRSVLGWARSVRGKNASLAVLAGIGVFAGWAIRHSTESNSVPTPPVVASPETAKPQPVSASPASVLAAHAPSRPPRTATELCLVEFTVRHPFAAAELAIWIDDKLAYQRQLHGQARKKMLVLKSIQGSFDGTLPVPAGEHNIRVQLSSETDGFQRSSSVRGDFRKDSIPAISIDVHGRERELSITISSKRP